MMKRDERRGGGKGNRGGKIVELEKRKCREGGDND